MKNKNETYVGRRETGWGSGIRRNVSTDVNRHEIQILEEGVLIEVFRSDVDQCKPVIESEAKRYLKRMQEENPNRSYRIRMTLNENPCTRGQIEKGLGC
jgi:hypothetical protein